MALVVVAGKLHPLRLSLSPPMPLAIFSMSAKPWRKTKEVQVETLMDSMHRRVLRKDSKRRVS